VPHFYPVPRPSPRRNENATCQGASATKQKAYSTDQNTNATEQNAYTADQNANVTGENANTISQNANTTSQNAIAGQNANAGPTACQNATDTGPTADSTYTCQRVTQKEGRLPGLNSSKKTS
jgi:hypothetical protein